MAVSMTGKIPTQRRDKAKLLGTHRAYLKKQDQNPGTARAVKQPGAAEAYPPSTTSIRDLEIIPLSQLRVDVHHSGQAVIVRTISAAYRGVASVSVVEDEHGSVDKIAVYNHSDTSILFNLPEGCTVVVKEPYYKCNAGGEDDYMICVDQPSDVLLLTSNDPIIPGPLRREVSRTAEDWKKAGDEAFLEKMLPAAVLGYTEGIEAVSADSALRTNLLSKRAGTNLALGRFDDAQADALASCAEGSVDWKPHFTAGRAAYGLRRYQDSHDHFRRALELSPGGSSSIRRELERCQARLSEEKHGSYDFRKMHEALGPRNVHLDHATFTARVQVADSPLHGRGLFAREHIRAGELVFCEKAALMPNQYDPSRASAALYATLVRQLYDNPSLAAGVLELQAGGDLDHHPRSGLEGTLVDGVPVVDVWLAEAIRRTNCLSAPLSTRDETRPRGARGVSQRTTKGLWPHAARMNHSCVPNTARSFLGDMLVARATRDVAPGEELLHDYTAGALRARRAQRQAELRRACGLVACACELCAGEARSSASEEGDARRTELLARMEKLASKRPPRGIVAEAAVRSMEKMAREMEEAHEPEVYDGLPRLMLVYPTMWLLEAYKGRRNHAKVVATALRVLRNFGFVFREEDGGRDAGDLFCRREQDMPSVLTIHVVTSLRDAAQACGSMGREEDAQKFQEAAKRGYMMLTGFEDDLSLLEGP